MVTPRGSPPRSEVGLSHPPPQLTHSDRAAMAATAPTKPPQGGLVTPSLSPATFIHGLRPRELQARMGPPDREGQGDAAHCSQRGSAVASRRKEAEF